MKYTGTLPIIHTGVQSSLVYFPFPLTQPSCFFSGFQVKEAVSEAEASLPEIVGVIPAGVGFERTQDAVQAFVSSAMMGVSEPVS